MLTDFSTVPVIDISGLESADPSEVERTSYSLADAAEQVGFMYVTNTGFPEDLYADLQRIAREYFSLTLAEKMEHYIGKSTNHRGYVPEGEEVFAGATPDRKESFDLSLDLPEDDPDYVAGNPLLGPNPWPAQSEFKEVVSAYYDEVWRIGRRLLSAFAIALGKPSTFFDEFLTKPPSQMRLIHYPYDASAEDRPGIGAHTDYECLTLLRGTTPGLEILNGNGDWIDAPPIEGSFVVNIGDMLELWTGGRLVATTHRVRKVQEERYAFPLFFNVDYDTVVSPLDGYVTEGFPAVPTTALRAGDHLFAQTAQSFRYLQAKLRDGQLVLPDGHVGLSSFGRQVRVS